MIYSMSKVLISMQDVSIYIWIRADVITPNGGNAKKEYQVLILQHLLILR